MTTATIVDAFGAIALGGLLWTAYAAGARRRAAEGAEVPGRAARRAYGAGAVVVVVALWPVVDDLAAERFAWHMLQHLLLLTVAAPLLASGRPELAFGRPAAPTPAGARRLVAAGLLASTLAVWGWHAPPLFDAALRSEPIHLLEHLTLLGAGVAFWWPLLSPTVRHAAGDGIVLLALVVGGLQSTVLGAFMAFASAPWYAPYVATARDGAFSALGDQQVAGLLMWIPPNAIQLLVAAWLFLSWIGAEDRDERSRRLGGNALGYRSRARRSPT